MNCNFPTDICFSFEGFHVRGGKTDTHKDGWGIAFFEGPGVRVFLDSKATIESPVAEMVRRYPIHSTNVIAHIRRATLGKIALENTHPFMRECWGRYWIFAHNGTLKGFAPPLNGRYKPVGQTDSELAFCYLMESLQARFPLAHPSRDELFQALDNITREIAAYGDLNYLLSNGDCLYAHCAVKLSYIVRRAPFSSYHLLDQDITVDFSHLTGLDRVAVIATEPLTDNEAWISIPAGQLLQFRDGEMVV